MAGQPILRRGTSTLSRQLTDGILVLAPAPAEALALVGTAGVLWEALAEPRALDDLVHEMQRRFRGDADRIAHDVTATVDQLLEAGVLEQ